MYLAYRSLFQPSTDDSSRPLLYRSEIDGFISAESLEGLIAFKTMDAVVGRTGLSAGEQVPHGLAILLKNAATMIIDADALNVLSRISSEASRPCSDYTTPGEFPNLLEGL